MYSRHTTIKRWAALGLAMCGAVALAAAGCASGGGAGAGKGAGPATRASADKGGAELWGETCGRCHNIRPPTQYSPAEWQVIVHHMRLRATLTTEEQRKITEFLKSAS
jgi:hypothetical protein